MIRLVCSSTVLYKQGQIAGIVDLRILHQQDHLHQSKLGIILHIYLVLQVLHHGEEDAGVAIPHKKTVDVDSARIGLLEGRDFPVIVQQDIDGDVGEITFHPGRHLHGGHLVGPDHQDHQVEMPGIELFNGLVIVAKPRSPGAWRSGSAGNTLPGYVPRNVPPSQC